MALALSACSGGSAIRTDDRPHASQINAIGGQIDSVLTAPEFTDAIWAAHVIDVRSGRTIYSRNSETNVIPASTEKLFTTAAALEQLGPDFTFETVLYADGQVRNDTLLGDLWIKGSGDPSLSDRYIGDAVSVLRDWADSLRQHGINVVRGRVRADDSLFDDHPLGLGWTWNDESYYYSAQISALSFNDNCVFVTATGTNPGEPAKLTWEPLQTDYVTVVNQAVTVAQGADASVNFRRTRGTNRIEAVAEIPAGESRTRCVTVENPSEFTASIFEAVLESEGIRVLQRDESATSSDPFSTNGAVSHLFSPVRIGTYRSPPLSRIARQVNKESENLDAELLLRSLGAYLPVADTTIARGSTAAGLASMARTLAAAGIDTANVGNVDGSGLSRRNLVTTDKVTRLLRYMRNHPDASVASSFVVSLPIGGLDGTLRSRYPAGAAARHAVAAKTGTMSFVSGLSGYVATKSGHPLAFSLICNNYSTRTSVVRYAQDSIVNLLSRM